MPSVMKQKFDFRIASALTFLCVSAILLLWIARFGPSWPYRDSFAYLYLLDRFSSDRPSIGWFVTMHNNEHFVAFQYSVALFSLWISGLRIKLLIFENAALLLAAGGMLLIALRHTVTARNSPLLLSLVVTVPLLNLSQAGYLMWEFQIFWYLDIALFAGSILLFERYRLKGYPAVFLLCVLATGAEATGALLWVSSAIHLIMIGREKSKAGGSAKGELYAASLQLLIFAWISWILVHRTDSAVAPVVNHDSFFIAAQHHAGYFLKVFGGGFGLHDELLSLYLGFASIAIGFFFMVSVLKNGWAAIETRVAIILTTLPILWVTAFAIGREKYGAAWALSDFHASPMIVPFFIGIGIFSVVWLGGSTAPLRRLTGFCFLLFSFVPVVSAFPFGYAHSRDVHFSTSLAAAATCSGNASWYVTINLNGLPTQDALFAIGEPYLVKMCRVQPDLSEWTALLPLPAAFAKFSPVDERDRYALRFLWDVYLTHADLQRAFRPNDPDVVRKLMDFAYFNAMSGGSYDQGVMRSFSDVFLRLRK